MGSAYDVVDLKPTWGGASLLMFGLIVLFLGAVAILARAYRGFHYWAVVLVLVVPLLSLVGSVLGILGLRRSVQKSTAWAGTVLNLAVFLSAIVAFLLSRAGV